MTQRLFHIVIIAVISIIACAAQTLPIDPDLHLGTLPNGMTYYIRHCNEPTARAECYLVHKVGSIMEEDNQRGIAHFLEHMAFNGTSHFPEQSLVSYLTASGMNYGGDINASTGFDQTIYHISNIPTTRMALLDSVLLIMSDLSGSLTLDEEAIVKEKAIIEEEWRSQSNSTVRLYEKALPLLMGNCRYADRIPIGNIDVVRNVTRDQLLEFYNKWFRPDLQALILVGDFDANALEKRVIEIFSQIPSINDAIDTISTYAPINKQAFVSCADAEATSTMVNVYFPFAQSPISERNTLEYLRENTYSHIVNNIINERLNNLSLKPESPIQYATCDIGDFLVNTTISSLTIGGAPKTGMAMPSLSTLLTEMRRIVEHGFTPSEVERACTSMNVVLDNALARLSNHTSSEYVAEYIDHFMNGGYIPGISWECKRIKEELAQITVSQLNEYAKKLIDFNHIRVLITGNDDATLPGEDEIRAMVSDVSSSNTAPLSDVATSTEPLLERMPAAGNIVSETTDSETGTTTLLLSNGIQVQLKPTTFESNEIVLNATSKGGYSVYGEQYATELRLIDHVVENSALGRWPQADLQQRLSSTPVLLVYQISDDTDDINGACHTADLETLLQLNYLYFTNVRPDTAAWQTLRSRLTSQIEQMASNSSLTFNDSIASTLYNHNPLYRPLTIDVIQNADFNKALDIYHERVSCPNNFTFTIVGSFDIDGIKPLIERYIASLPIGKEHSQTSHRITYATGDRDVVWLQPMQAPKGTIYTCLMGDMDYSLRNAILTEITGQVMQVALTAHLREELRGTYGVSASSALSRSSNKWIINANFETEPTRTQEMVEALAQVFDVIMSYGTTPKLLEVIKGQMLKEYETALNTNAYWLNTLRNKALGYDSHTSYKQIIENLTIDDLNNFITTLNPSTRLRIIMQGYAQ
ncbi:MAG: insulinase family protein [Muribaculaceae bacterium]|nr:insulinase family protein [Muribaculaceae bacterium]